MGYRRKIAPFLDGRRQHRRAGAGCYLRHLLLLSQSYTKKHVMVANATNFSLDRELPGGPNTSFSVHSPRPRPRLGGPRAEAAPLPDILRVVRLRLEKNEKKREVRRGSVFRSVRQRRATTAAADPLSFQPEQPSRNPIAPILIKARRNSPVGVRSFVLFRLTLRQSNRSIWCDVSRFDGFSQGGAFSSSATTTSLFAGKVPSPIVCFTATA